MELIGTHKSVTGEKGFGFIQLFHWLGRTQTLTVADQAKAGVKYFDICIRRTERGWVCANGIWETKKLFTDILSDISKNTSLDSVLLGITYEGTLPKDMSEESFVRFIKKIIKKYSNLSLYSISEKYKKSGFGKKRVWNIIWRRDFYGYKFISYFPKHSLFKFFPIPFLWKLKKPEFSEDLKTITLIDFFNHEDIKN